MRKITLIFSFCLLYSMIFSQTVSITNYVGDNVKAEYNPNTDPNIFWDQTCLQNCQYDVCQGDTIDCYEDCSIVVPIRIRWYVTAGFCLGGCFPSCSGSHSFVGSWINISPLGFFQCNSPTTQPNYSTQKLNHTIVNDDGNPTSDWVSINNQFRTGVNVLLDIEYSNGTFATIQSGCLRELNP